MRNAMIIKPPERPAFAGHVQWSGATPMLSPPECEWLISRTQSQPLHFASVGTPTVQRVEHATRCVESASLEGDDLDWLYQRITDRVTWANEKYWQFDLGGIYEPAQFLKYTPSTEDKPDGHYTWHVDFGEGAMGHRKLSLVIQLSPDAAYDGCDFTLAAEFGLQTFKYREQGAAWLFPSWAPHRVSPITRGTRYALVAWIGGPRFR